MLLIRQRAGGTDRLVLHQTAPGRYRGRGRFYAPLMCGSRIYPKGESVPFTIRVEITATNTVFGLLIATRLHATYTNKSRKNLTRCVAVPGHDAAVYDGQIISGQSP